MWSNELGYNDRLIGMFLFGPNFFVGVFGGCIVYLLVWIWLKTYREDTRLSCGHYIQVGDVTSNGWLPTTAQVNAVE